MTRFLKLEKEAEIQAATEAALTAEAFKAKNKTELAEIGAGIRARFTALSKGGE